MMDHVRQAERSLAASGLVVASGPQAPLLAAWGETRIWNRPDPLQAALEPAMDALGAEALVWCRPEGAHAIATRHLVRQARRHGAARLCPADSETRTFLHDIPIAPGPIASGFVTAGPVTAGAAPAALTETLVEALRRRKGCLVDMGDDVPAVLALGAVTPDQACVVASSILFACFVQFFSQALLEQRQGVQDRAARVALLDAAKVLPPLPETPPPLARGPFEDEAAARLAICEAGRRTVALGLVDSCFGNVSYRVGNTLHVSQTGAPLDALEGAIDPCALDGGSTAAMTASSECAAHRAVVENPQTPPARAILHGHPPFAVILSMDCPGRGGDAADPCPSASECHIACPRARALDEGDCADIPVVPGEVGMGPAGLCHTMPPALAGRRGAMVFGHGLFAADAVDFNGALATLLEVERACRREVLRRLQLA